MIHLESSLFSLAGSLGRTVLSRENIPSCVALVFLKLGLKLSKSKQEQLLL